MRSVGVMKAITIRQPWASLIAHGVKTIETRSRRINHRGPVAIHAGQRLYTAADKHADRDLWFAVDDALGGLERNNGVYDLPYGAIVATADLTQCMPVYPHGRCPETPGWYVEDTKTTGGDRLWICELRADGGITNWCGIEDQRPYGDFTAGRYAWELTDVQSTTERCPRCWGDGTVNCLLHPGHPPVDEACFTCWNGDLCPVCDGSMHCDPIVARGQQATPWEWSS